MAARGAPGPSNPRCEERRDKVSGTHRVHFDPVGLEIEVEEDETVLDGAFRQGVMLMHGCKEGQCSACKSFLIEGDIDMEKYSTFALADYESEEGYILLCRTHAYSDLQIELINYDEEMLKSGIPIQELATTVRVNEALTHDIRRLVLDLVEPREIAFLPGQYVDITIPGTTSHRSFSMANTPTTDNELEFFIKCYPGGHFSGLLEDGLPVGQELAVKGPYGTFVLRESTARLIFIGGGAGMAPIVSLLTAMAEQGVDRPATYYYGARTEADLFYLAELAALGERLPGLSFVPALSHDLPDSGWTGETGFVTDVLDRSEGDLADADLYLCGPPPMIDAAIAVLVAKGADEKRIFFDKFTTTAGSEE